LRLINPSTGLVPSFVDLGCHKDNAGFVDCRLQVGHRMMIDAIVGAKRCLKRINFGFRQKGKATFFLSPAKILRVIRFYY